MQGDLKIDDNSYFEMRRHVSVQLHLLTKMHLKTNFIVNKFRIGNHKILSKLVPKLFSFTNIPSSQLIDKQKRILQTACPPTFGPPCMVNW